MFSISKTIPIWLVLIAVIFINTFITAQEISPSKSGSIGPSETCVPCDNVPIKCPVCEEGTKCILTLRTCSECQKSKCVKLSPDELSENESKKADQNSNKALLPAVIGGILGVGFLAAIGYGYFVWRRRTRNERGVKLDNNEEMISVDGENVIPIAYIPTTPTTPKPEPTYTRLRISQVSGGTSPLTSPLPRLNNEQLIDIADDDDIVSDGCTILQATKTAPTATLMTATRVKPSLVRLNTIKSSNTDVNSAQSTKSGNNSIPNTPKTPMTDNTFLITPSVSSIPSSPTSNLSLVIEGDSEPEQMTPRIDIERSSAESSRVTGQNSQYLNSPSLDPIEGRQSFGLFGSDEVYSNDPSSPQLQRESILSSTSSNGRSTMFSDDGDGEITIFWGGNAPPFAGGGQIQTKKLDDQVDSTDKNQNEKTKT